MYIIYIYIYTYILSIFVSVVIVFVIQLPKIYRWKIVTVHSCQMAGSVFSNLSIPPSPRPLPWDMYNFFVVANLSANQRLALCGAADVVGGWDENKALMILMPCCFWDETTSRCSRCLCDVTTGRLWNYIRSDWLRADCRTGRHKWTWAPLDFGILSDLTWKDWCEIKGLANTATVAFWLQSCHTVCHAWLPLRFHLAWLLQMHVSYYILMFIYLLDWDYPRNALGHHSCFCTLLRLGNQVIQYRNETSKELQRCCVTVHHAFK